MRLIVSLLLTCLPCGAALVDAQSPSAAAAGAAAADLSSLYAEGQTYEEFLGAARRRATQWRDTTMAATVDEEMIRRAAAAVGRWRLLVVAVDACSDSVSTLPYVAKLVAGTQNLGLRIVDPARGRAIMEAHRTPDHRPATPTLVLLDEAGRASGCWIERPSALQSWVLGEGVALSRDEVYARKKAWYARDRGTETLREIVGMIEAAAAGRPACPAAR